MKVYVEDNGIGRKYSQEIKTKYQKENVSTAMKNIESRLKLINDLYKIKVEVEVEDLNKEKQEGTRVVIKLTEDSLVNF